MSDTYRCQKAIPFLGWVAKGRFRDDSRHLLENREFWGKIVSFTTFFATNVVNSPGIARGTTWGSSSLKTTLYTPLSLWTTLFEQIGVILAHFESNRIFMKKYSVEYFFAIFSWNCSISAKNVDFFQKSWNFFFFQKSKYLSKMHEIEVWWTQRDAFSICIARIRLRAIRSWNFETYGDFVNGKSKDPKFRF